MRTLTYRRDQTTNLLFDNGQVMGPNQLGEFVQVVKAEHDPATDITKAYFRYVPRDEEHRIVRSVDTGNGLLLPEPAKRGRRH